MEIEINASEHSGPATLAQEIREKVSQLYVDWVWVQFPRARHRVTPNTAEHVCKGLMIAAELLQSQREAAELADEKSDGQAENSVLSPPPGGDNH